MTSQSFDAYGRLALSKHLTPTEKSGRYAIQGESERRILLDVIYKLEISSDDILMDIGCGTGLLIVPLSYLVQKVTGLDHPSVVANLSASHPKLGGDLVGANFFEWESSRRFTKVLSYGVINYVSNLSDARKFVLKAAGLLEFGGRLLIGDIPNSDRKRRFLNSETGRRFSEEWTRKMKSSGPAPSSIDQISMGDSLQFDDAAVLDLLSTLRDSGYDAFVVPQPPDLPFGHTREDILVHRPPA